MDDKGDIDGERKRERERERDVCGFSRSFMRSGLKIKI